MADTPTTKVGTLTRDPELRFGKSGTSFTTFGLAWRPFVPKGEPEPETTFYEVVCFKSLAEHVAECLQKGDRVIVTGRGEVEKWTGRDGVERTTKKLTADSVGPDLRFTTVELKRTERREPTTTYGHDEEPF